MKVEGPGSIKTTAAPKRARASGPTGSNFAAYLDESAAEPGGVSGTAPKAAVSGLVAVQAEGSATDGQSRGKRDRALRRGSDLLARLDRLRHGLLTGTISLNELENLSQDLAQQAEAVDDPALAELIAEIELRCAVELAKLADGRSA